MHQLNHLSMRHQKGITLLESLVAILVSAVGILGILGMQMRTLTDTQTTVRRGQAIRLIEDLSERMKVNPNAMLNISSYASDYTKTTESYSSATDCSSTSCTPEQQIGYDLKQWKASVQQTLPIGRASIFFAPGETIDTNRRQLGVMIAWRENEREGTKTDEIDASKIIKADGSFGAGTNTDNACPEGFTCHLQYLPIPARCAPYGNAVYCS